VLSGEATNANFIVFCHTRQKLKHTFYRTQSEQFNHYQCGWKTKYDGEKLPLAAYNFIF
jgi:hypothetical protein